MSIKRKALRTENRAAKNKGGKVNISLKERLLRGSLAIGFTMAPWAMPSAYADIVRVDGGTTDTVGSVHNIYAGQVKGDNAINRFQKFELPANQIANMYFTTKGGTTEAKSLFNFVDSRINIDGTVNALRNNTIGGHMYFLSKDGLTLGSKGVINAGALTIMNGVDFPSSNGKAFSKIEDVLNLNQSQDDGSIDIKGTINAVDLVHIVSNYKLNVHSGANINTTSPNGKRDFTKLVNIGSINSGLGNNLVVSRSKDSKGNVALIARATNYNEDNAAIHGWLDVATKNTVGAYVNVESNATIKSDGETSIGAYADCNAEFGNLLTFGNIGQSRSGVTIAGTVEGDTVNIVSSATNNFTQSVPNKIVSTGRKFVTEWLQRAFKAGDVAGLEIDVVALKAYSDLTVASEANITATGKDTTGEEARSALNLQSISNVVASQGAAGNTTGKDKRYFGAGVLISILENDAKLNVAGGASLTTTDKEGSITAAANAKTSTDLRALAAPNNTSSPETAYVTVSLNLNDGHTKSKVNIAKNAKLNAAKDVNLLSNTSLSTSNLSLITNAQDVYVSTSMLYMDMESSADVNVDGLITAGNSVKLDAKNTEKIFTKSSNNTTEDGAATWLGYLANPTGGDFASLTNTVINETRNFVNEKWGKLSSVPDPVFKSNGWTAGATINVTLLENQANINVGNTASIAATKDINIKALQGYDDLLCTAVGSSSKIKNPVGEGGATKKEVVVSAAIGYIEKNDAANVNIAGSTSGNAAKLVASTGDINISANAEYIWNRYNSMVKSLMSSWDAVTVKSLRDSYAEGQEVPAELEAYYQNPTVENFEKLQLAIANTPTFFSGVGDIVLQVLNVGSLVRKAEQFANAATYVNVNVGTTVRPASKNADDISVAISGAVLNYGTKANVVVGRNAELTAGKTIDITSKTKMVDANYFGTSQGILGTFGADWGLSDTVRKVLGNLEIDVKVLPGWSRSEGDVYGGNIGITVNDIQSNTVIAEGVKLTAQNIKANADTDLQRVLVTLGGGSAGNTGVTGMLSVNYGNTNSIVSIDDEAKITTTGSDGLALNADNDSLLVNVDGDITASHTKAVGVSFGYSQNNVITAAGIFDNDKATLDNAGNMSEDSTEDKRKKQILQALEDSLSSTQEDSLGNTEVQDAAFNVAKLSIDATSTPEIISVGVAGAVSTKKNSREANAGRQDASGADVLRQQTRDEMVDLGANDNADDTQNEILNSIGNNQSNVRVNNNHASFTNLMGAGAVQISRFDGVTASLLEKAKVNFTTGSRALDLYAHEDGLTATVAGAMALRTGAKEGASSVAMLSGTSAVNAVNMDVLAQVKDATIKDALSITNEAKQAETIAAAAAPISLDVSGSDLNVGFTTAMNASVNLIDNHVHANLNNNTVSMTEANWGNLTRIQNLAYDASTQITGAISLEVAKTAGLGLNAVFAQMWNDVQANVVKGTYMSIDGLENIAATNLLQVNAAVGVAAGSNNLALGAIWSHAKLDNNIEAVIDGATITAKNVENKAVDAAVDDKKQSSVSWKQAVQALGFDAEGAEYKDIVQSEKVDLEFNEDVFDESVEDAKKYKGDLDDQERNATYSEENYTSKKLELGKDKSSTVINGALSLAAEGGERSKLACAVAVTDAVVDNDYTASIKNAKITASDTAKGVTSLVNNDNLIVDFAAGISGTGSRQSLLAGAGSAAAVRLRNDAVASIEDSEISSGKIDVKAKNAAEIVDVAGAMSIGVGGTKVGIGLSVAASDVENTTTAKALGSTLQGYDGGSTAVDIQSFNNGDIKTIAAGIVGSDDKSYLAAYGNVAVNVGHNNTEAYLDHSLGKNKVIKNSSKINKASKVNVYAEDTTEEVAAAAGANIAGSKTAVGLSFAVNRLDDQSLKAAMNNTAVTTAKDAKINVETKEEIALRAIGVGAGIGIGKEYLNFQGAASITLARNKQNVAELNGGSIEGAASDSADAEVVVKAYQENEIIGTGDAISASFSSSAGVPIGIGAVGINLDSTTKASINNIKKLNASDVEVNALGKQRIYDVAVGISASAQTVNAAGSLSFNILNDDVTAEITGSTINASNSVGVFAKGDDELVNVTGGLNMGFASTVGIGVAVASNSMAGNVTATVKNSDITALGKGSKQLTAHEYSTSEDEKTKNKLTLTENKHKGLVVDAYSEHDITDVVVSGGLAVNTSSAGVALNGLGATTEMTGTTGAYLENSNVNKNNADTNGDVVVTAYDAATLNDVAVNVAAAFGNAAGVSVGAAVTLSDFDRTIEAKTSNGTINAAKLIDTAGGKTSNHMVTVGVSVGVSATAGAGVGALVDSVNSKNKVHAEISQVTSKNDGVTLKASHDNYLNYTGVGIVAAGGQGSGSVGVAVGTINDTNTITGVLDKVNVSHRDDKAEDYVAVTNYSNTTPDLIAVTLSAGIGSGSVGVASDSHSAEDLLSLNIKNSSFGLDKKAKNVTAKVDNHYIINKTSTNVSIAGSLGGGVGVSVQPVTINSSELLNITGSNFATTGNVHFTANETRDIDMVCVNVAGSTLIGVGVTNTMVVLGGKQDSVVTTTNNGELDEQMGVDLGATINKSDNAVDEGKQMIVDSIGDAGGQMNVAASEIKTEEASQNTLTKEITDIEKDIAARDHYAQMGTETVSGVTLKSSNTNVTAKDINIKAITKDNIDIVSGTGTLGLVGVNVNTASLKENVSNKLEILGGTYVAENTAILGTITGEAKTRAVMAGVAGVGVNVGHARVIAEGKGNNVTVEGASLTTSKGLLVRALHDTDYFSYSDDYGVNAIQGGYLEAKTEDKLDNKLRVANSKLINTAENEPITTEGVSKPDTNTADKSAVQAKTGSMEIAAMKMSQVRTKSRYGGVNGIGGLNSYARSKVDATNRLDFSQNEVKDISSIDLAKAGIVDLYSRYSTVTDCYLNFGGGSVIAGGGGVFGTSENKGKALLNVDKNSFDVANLRAQSLVTGIKDNVLAKNHGQTINIAVGIGVGKNKLDTTINTSAQTSLSENSFAVSRAEVNGNIIRYEEVEKLDVEGNLYKAYEPVYEQFEQETAKTALEILAETNAKADSDISCINVGGILAVGHNDGVVTINESTDASLTGKQDAATLLKSLSLKTKGTNDVYNKVYGGGGGILSISPKAATAENVLTVTNDVKLKGKFKVEEAAAVEALQTDIIEIQADTESGGAALDVAGGDAKNTRNANSHTIVTLSEADLEADSASIVAQNNMDINKKFKYGMKGGSGAGVIAAASPTTLTNTVTELAGVEIGKSSVATANNLHIQAATENNIFALSLFENGSILVGVNQATVNNSLNYTNKVNVDANSTLTTGAADSLLDINSVDNTLLNVGSYAHAYGAILTVALPETNNTTKRNNYVNIAGRVNSANDLAINAGQYADNSIAGLTAVIDVMTYSGGLIPARDRKLTNEIEQHNVVTISGSTSSTTSIADTDIYANEGAVNITVNNISSGSYSSDKSTKGYVSSDTASTNPSDVSLKGENKVKIEGGSVVAGAKHSVELEIGKLGEVVILNEQERAAFKTSNPTIKVTGTPTISGTGDLEVEFKQVNLSTELYGQYLKQQDVVASYSTNKSSEAYAVAVAKLKAIEDQLIALGMTSRDAQGNILVTGSVVVDAVVLPKISVSGGNVNINTQDIAANYGRVEAYGTPTASVINNTSLYLILDDINVGERGGEIKYNNNKLKQGDAAALIENIALIKGLNKNVKDPSFTSLHAESSQGGKVNIQSNYAGAKEFEVNTTYENEQVTAISKVMPNIELGYGASVINKSGNIDIYSAAGDIVLNGNVNGKEINVRAAQGSLYQNSVQGLVNIGGDVKQQYESLVKDVISKENSYLKGNDAHKTGSYTSDTVAASDKSKGTIMGNSVYISADTINVNGLIQSGYAEYKLEVGSEAELQKINELNTKYANSNYTDDEIIRMGGNSQFVVVAGGQAYDSAKDCYYYKVPVYYNPATKKLLVPNVEDYGGNISLTGKIASTGNGRLVAMDGTYDIAANNKTTYDLKLYGLTTTKVEGKITIVDTAKHQQTELTRTSYKVTDFTSSSTSDGVISGSYTYKPLENQRYSWSLGKDESTRSYYERKYETNWWGLRESVDVTSHTGDYSKTSEVKLAGTAKDEGNAITELKGYTNNFAVSLDKQKTSESKSEVAETRWTTGLFGFRKHQLYKWYEDTGYSYTYNASVDASKDIKISFIGNTDNSSTISVSSGGSIDVHGNIGSKDLNNTINLTSNKGGIYQDKGYLRADTVALQAVGAMSGINILSDSELVLSATNNAKADTTYWRNGVGSKTGSEGNAININVETQLTNGTVKLVGTNGNANNNSLVSLFDLSTNGSIVSGTNTAISAARVDLTATNGSIGTASKAILVNTGDIPVAADSLSASLNAQASGNIYLAEASGDMRVGKIYSDKGDVSLRGPGSLVDALPYDSVNKGRSEAELVALWENLGLLENKTAKETTTVDNGNPLYEYKTTSEQQADGTYYKVVTEKVQARDAEGRLLYEVEKDVQAWDAQRLLYAISNAIINPEPGVELPTKVANIKADNLSLNMGDSAGLNSNTTTVYKIDELGMRDDLADLKDIARADARDVTWDEAHNEVRITRKLPIGVMLKGTVSVNAGQINGADNEASNISGNVYLEGRKDSLANTQAADLNIKQIAAKGDVILANASGSILNANSNSGMAVIKANNLTIDAGPKDGTNGSIGTADKWLNVSIKGGLNATSNAGIYLEQIGADTLLLQGIASKGDIYLTALNDIVSDTSLGNNSYINLVNPGSITLQSLNGNVGTEDKWLRVLNGDDTTTNDKHLVVEAAKSAYIKGMSTAQDGASAGGTLYVENIAVGSGESIHLDANGGICFVKAQAAAIDAKAALGVEQSQDSILEAEVFTVQAGKGITLAGANNKLHKVALYNSGSNTELQNVTEKQPSTIINSGDKELELVAVGRSKEAADEAFVGNLILNNVAGGSANDIKITGKAVVEGTLNIENAEQSIYVPAVPATTDFSVSADKITLTAQQQVTNAGVLVARNGISLSGKAGVENTGTITTAEGNISLTATNSTIKNEGMLMVEKKGNITIEAEKHIINRGVLNIQGAGNIALTSGEQGSVFSLKDGELYTGEGNIDLRANSSTYSVIINGNAVTNDSAVLNAADEGKLLAGNVVGAVINSANAAAIGGTFAITSNKGSIFNFNNFSNANAEGGDLTFNLASQDIRLAAAEGRIFNNIDLYSEARVSLLAKSGLSNLSYTIFGAKGVTLQATEGDVINSSVIESSSGDIRLLADKGSVVNVSGADLVTAGGNVILESGTGAVVDNKLYYATNQGEIVSLGEQAVYSVNRYYLDNGNKVVLTATMEAPANATVKTEILGANNVVLADLAGDIAVFRKGAVVNYGNTLAGINADVKNSGNVILQSAKGDVFNYFDFNNISKRADGSISAKYTGSTYAMGTGINSVSIAANDLTLSAVKGKVFNSKRQLTAGRDVTIIAKEGMANFAYDVQAGRNITLTATEGLLVNNARLTAASGIIKLEAQKGSVVNMLHGDAVAQEGSVAMLAGGIHDNQLQLVDTNGKTTQLVVKAVAKAGSASDLTLNLNGKTAGNDTILVDKYYKNGSAYVRMDEHTDITSLTTEQQASIVTVFYQVNDSDNTKHLVTGFEAEGMTKATITVNGIAMLGVKGDVEAFRQGDVINRGNIVAGGGSVALKAAQGNIINYDNYELFNGKANTEALGATKEIKSHKGTSIVAGLKIYNNMDINAGEDLLISGGDAVISGQEYNHLYALGKLIIESTGSSLVNNADLVGEKGVILRAYGELTNTGNITSHGVVELLAGGIDNSASKPLNTEAARLTNSGDLTAGSHVRVETNIGDITLTGVDIVAKNNSSTVAEEQMGYINIATTSGNIVYNNGADTAAHSYVLNAKAEDGITVQTGNGSITSTVNYEAGKSIALTAAKTGTNNSLGSISQVGNLQAGHYAVDNEGYAVAGEGAVAINGAQAVSVQGDIFAADGIVVASSLGTVAMQGELKAGTAIDLAAEGKITAAGDMYAGNNISVGHNVGHNIDATHAAAVEITNSVIKAKGNVTLEAEGTVNSSKNLVTTENGSIRLQSFTEGDVLAERNELNAKKRNELSAKNNIELLAKKGNVVSTSYKDDGIYPYLSLVANEGMVKLFTEQGNVSTKGIILSETGVTLEAGKGNITNNATISSGDSITLKAGAEQGNGQQGNVINNGALLANATNKNVKLEAAGSVTNNSVIFASGSIEMLAGASVRNNAALAAEAGHVSLAAGDNVENMGGRIFAAKDISLTGGDFVTNRASALLSTDGNISLSSTGADGGVQNLNSSLTAQQGQISLTANIGNVLNAGQSSAITAGQDIVLATTVGDVRNEAAATTEAGKIALTTGSGSVTNEGKLNIETASTEANKGTVELRGTDFVENTGIIKAQGQVDLVAEQGYVLNKEDIATTEGSVNLNGIKSVINHGSIKAVEGVTLGSTNGAGLLHGGTFAATNVTNAGAVTSAKGDISLIGSGEIINYRADLVAGSSSEAATGSIVLQSTGAGDVDNYESTLIANKGNITLKTNSGDVLNYIVDTNEYRFVDTDRVLTAAEVETIEIDGSSMYALDANGERRLVVAHSITNLSAANNVLLQAVEGNILNDGGIEAKQGSITEQTAKGTVYNLGDLTAEKGVSLEASADVFNLFADLTSKTEGITLKSTASGDVYNLTSDLTAQKDVLLQAQNGNIVNSTSDIKAAAGSISLRAEESGDIYNLNNSLTADVAMSGAKDISMTTAKGEILNFGANLTASGSVELSATAAAEYGDVQNINSSITAGGAVTLRAAQGELVNYLGAIVAGKKSGSNADVQLLAAYDVLNLGSAITTDKGSVVLQSTGSGNITNDFSAITTGEGNISITTASGAVENSYSNLSTANGNIAVAGTKDVVLNNSAVKATNGNVSITSSSTAYGEVLLTESNITAGTGARGTASITSANGDIIIRNSDVKAGASIAMASNKGNISNFNVGDVVVDTDSHVGVTVTAAKNVEVTSLAGNIANYGVTTAENEDVSLTAFAGAVINYANITANGGTISLSAYDPAKSAGKGNVSSLNTYNANTVISAAKGVDLFAMNELQNDSDVNVKQGNITITSVNSTVHLGVNSNNANKLALYNVEQTGNIIVKADKDIVNQTKLQIGDVSNKTGGGNIYLTSAQGGITNQGNAELVTANGNITMLAEKNIVNNGEAYARGGEIYLESFKGDVNNTDDFDKYKGTKTDLATSHISIMAKEGKLFNEHNLVSGGNITLVAKEGLQNFSYYLSAIGDVSLTATAGDLINSSAILSQQGSIYLTAEQGAVVNVAGDAVANMLAYDVTSDDFALVENISMHKGDLYALGGDVILRAGGADDGTTKNVNGVSYGSGDVVNMGSIVALGSHKVAEAANTGYTVRNQTFASTLTEEYFEPGKVGLYSARGNVLNKDTEYHADGTRNATALMLGATNYVLSLGDIELVAEEGSILNNFSIDAGGSVRAVAKEDVSFSKSGANGQNAMVITRVGGDLGISSITGVVDGRDFDMTANGNILVEGYKGIELSSDVTSLTGSVMLAAANGSIYKEVSSQTAYGGTVKALSGMAVIGAGLGDIEVKAVLAKDVVLYAPKGDFKVNLVGALDSVTAQAQKMSVDELTNLNSGASGKAPALAIMGESYTAKHKGDIHFSYLNVNSSDIVVENGSVAIDKLQVKDVAHITASGYKVGIYGPAGSLYRDDSAAIFFDANRGTAAGDRPIADLSDFFNFKGEHTTSSFLDRFSHIGSIIDNMQHEIDSMDRSDTWNKDTKGWMNLYIDSGSHARSNGILLHRKYNYYVDNARYPQDDLARITLKSAPYGLYDLAYTRNLGSDFTRYDLVNLKQLVQNDGLSFVFNESDISLFESVLEHGEKTYRLGSKSSKKDN